MGQRPKRRKSKDNPYTLGYNDNENIYVVSFIDVRNERQEIEVSESVFSAFDRFELEDISQLHKIDKHIDLRRIENDEYTDSLLYNHVKYNSKSLEEEVAEKILLDEIKEAMNLLTETQKRRIKMYYFEDMNFKEIAKFEKCDESSVRESIYKGIEKIKKILKQYPL